MTADQIAQILDTLGQKLGPAGQQVFALAVREQIIEGILGVFAVLPALLCIYLMTRIVRWAKTWPEKSYSTDNDGRGVTALLSGGALAVLAVLLLFAAVGSIPKLLNPEWAAISALLSGITGSH